MVPGCPATSTLAGRIETAERDTIRGKRNLTSEQELTGQNKAAWLLQAEGG